MYKNQEKQRSANRVAQAKRRRGMTKGMTEPGMTEEIETSPVIPSGNLVEQCMKRAASGKSYRDGDPCWPYTRHLTPAGFVAWCSIHKPSWLTPTKPGDAGYTDGPGTCLTCGSETPCHTIVKCTACCLAEWAQPTPLVGV